MKRFLIELGIGVDLHGEDVTKAAKRAIKDAMSRCCMCALVEILNVDLAQQLHTIIKVACPKPEEVNIKELQELIPFGKASVEVVEGGLSTDGLHVDELGPGDQIVVAVASLTVCIEQEENIASIDRNA